MWGFDVAELAKAPHALTMRRSSIISQMMLTAASSPSRERVFYLVRPAIA